jgi:hypothetical protein
VGKPFPVIDDTVLEDVDWPRDLYVFPGGRSAPTIVYMPLFNQRNCRGISRDAPVYLGFQVTTLVVVEGER